MKSHNTTKATELIDISANFPSDAALYSDAIVYFSATVWSLVENSVSCPEYLDDYGKAVFNVLWNSQANIVANPTPTLKTFNVGLPGNAHDYYLLKCVKSVNSEGKPTVTICTMGER